jgi:hypothetical protein
MMPTILAFALINPFAWFLISSGRTRRSLNIACLMAPVSIFGAVLGLQFGPKGVALALSTMMTLLTVPIIAWARAGTTMRGRDIWRALHGPLLAGSVAAIFGFAVSRGLDLIVPTPADLMLGAPLIYGVYFFVLLFPLKQADLYRDLVKQVLRRPT